MDSAPLPDLERLAQLALARRRHLGLTVTAITAKVGLSKDTYAHIEKAEPVTASSYAKAERALGWGAGSIRNVLNGGEPTLAPPPAPAVPRISAAEVSRVLASVLLETAGDWTGTQIRETAQRQAAALMRLGLVEEPTEGENP